MEPLYWFATAREVYRAGACAISCFDARFELVIRKFLARVGAVPVDHVRVAGGAKALASTGDGSAREFLLEQVRASIRLHATGRVILLAHSDCGACGGLEAFGGDTERERAWHGEQLDRAAAAVREAVAGVTVKTYFVDFNGVWEVVGTDHVCAN